MAMRALILALPLFVACAAQAEVYKCTDEAGRKHYQDRPCENGQHAASLDPAAGNVTTIDSQTARREMQGALLTREEIRERHIAAVAPASGLTQVIHSNPASGEEIYLEDAGGYPVYPYVERGYDSRRHHRHDRHRPRIPRRPDPTPMIDPPRGQGGNYVPEPPTIRQVAPRPPATAQRPTR